MFKYIYKKLNFIRLKNLGILDENIEDNTEQVKLSCDLNENIKILKNILGGSDDIVYRAFSFGENNKMNAAIIFLSDMVKGSSVNNIMMQLFNYNKLNNMEIKVELNDMDIIKSNIISVGEVNKTQYINEVVDGCLSGDAVLLIDGLDESLIIYSRDYKGRRVEESKTEAVVRGPREGFSENISINISLLRHKIRNPNLTFKSIRIGRQTRTSIYIVYLKGIANPKLVGEVCKRLKRINTDAILESGYIEQFIEDTPYSIFPTVGNSEKPDTAAAKILEGKVGILVDGTPFILTVPMLFIEGFQNAEDYYSRTYYSSILRILRFICFIITILLPATYVMLAAFHQELIPTTLLFTIAAGREGVPFPAIMEAGLMVITFEILREAGVRLPRPIGQAVSIVGALVIGQAAVSAGLVGGILVIVVALTGVSSFVVPVFTDTASILRIILLILSGTLGIFGVGLGLLVTLIHVVSIRSFGTPYLSPLAPLEKDDLKDSFIRTHMWKMSKRPHNIGVKNIKRQGENLKPEPPKDDDKLKNV
ncbi:spore germination protein [Clostridium sp. JN-1]|uniref:spore germination protein n=1 Tax=Clostridium sp. JN-1 TaxID=2483110 RepID=UPI000F0BA4B0|nr:spore germination protein [Clostridium sp. JN-1]